MSIVQVQGKDAPISSAEEKKAAPPTQVLAIANHIKTSGLIFSLPASVTQAAVVLHVGSVQQAKSLAYFVFWNLLPTDSTRRHILLEDVRLFYGTDEKKAKLAFEMLDVRKLGIVTASDVRKSMTLMFKYATYHTHDQRAQTCAHVLHRGDYEGTMVCRPLYCTHKDLS
jgi:hypothetical protein